MSSIVKRRINGCVYLYESESYRNEEGKPRTRQRCIGKIDPDTGEAVYNKAYKTKMAQKGTPIQEFSASDIQNSTIKEFGAFYLYKCIAEEIGLLSILRSTLPNCWQMVFNLACYLVSSGDPVMYCEDWVDKTAALPSASMSPPRISELFKMITLQQRLDFFAQWGAFRCEQEYLALDITSVSSYSKLIADVEWGYNRDKEKLPQINLCLLLGEQSGLPVFQSVYNGSLKDVSTLKTTLQLAAPCIPLHKMTIVMDKGFCSTKNINAMLSDPQGLRFLIAMPFTMSFTKKQVDSERKGIDCFNNAIVIGDDVLRGVAKERSWSSKHKLFAHVYYNAAVALSARDKLYAHVLLLKKQAGANPEAAASDPKFTKYLLIRKSNKHESGYTINPRDDVIEQALAHSGWLVLTSNHISDAREAISIYRAKDVVEKGFFRMKNALDLNRLRVHSDASMQNKIFVGFIALVLMSHIHKVMFTNELYKSMTMHKLINILSSLKVQYLAGVRILFPITKIQKNIIEAFGFSEPL